MYWLEENDVHAPKHDSLQRRERACEHEMNVSKTRRIEVAVPSTIMHQHETGLTCGDSDSETPV